MNQKRVLLLFGGESSEHDVSISSARNVYGAIDNTRYDTSLCFIDREGNWYLLDDFNDYQNPNSDSMLLPILGKGKFLRANDRSELVFDVIFPVLHGRNGEDGSVQGLAQLLHIPIVGCDVTGSAIGMDKVASKEIAQAHDVQIVPYATHRQGAPAPDFDALQTQLGLPLFIKPSRAGSSVGVSKVHNYDEFVQAIKNAHIHDSFILIEKAIAARELEVAVLGTPPHHKVSGVGEIIPGEEFYSYEDKYAATSKAGVNLRADLSDETTEQVRNFAKVVYEALGCSGLARVDFFLDETGQIYFNEINTLPGFTNISMYPKLWQAAGIEYPQLIEELISDALSGGTIKAES